MKCIDATLDMLFAALFIAVFFVVPALLAALFTFFVLAGAYRIGYENGILHHIDVVHQIDKERHELNGEQP